MVEPYITFECEKCGIKEEIPLDEFRKISRKIMGVETQFLCFPNLNCPNCFSVVCGTIEER